MPMIRRFDLALLVLGVLHGPSAGAAMEAGQLAELSLEQLREVVVSTVSRAEERLDRVAASVYVISADDIRRSGATTLPEALRLAPLLSVARADGNQYAISARGFDNVLANKMLVLIDGRNVYTPLFSGVFWEAQDVMLEDVERIEVVSGPSTALWGSNAVNALVHVITRRASETQGLLASVDIGTSARGAALRWGGMLGAGSWRAYVKSYARSDTRRADGSSVDDTADGVQLGGRADWSRGSHRFTLHGDAYQGTIDPAISARRFSGTNVTAQWNHTADSGAQTSLQGVLDHTERDHRNSFSEVLDTLDVAGQHSTRFGAGHQLVVGGGLRRAWDRTSGSPGLAFRPADRRLDWQRVFAQTQLRMAPALALTLAASLEQNPHTGSESLPSLRLAWTGIDNAVLWMSLSRALRAPSRTDRELFSPAQPPHVLAGGPDFRSELSRVLELGWRAQPAPALSYGLTLYYAQHRRLRSLAPTAEGAQWRNAIEGRSAGLEAWGRWRVVRPWRLDAGLVLHDQQLQVSPGSLDLGGMALLGNSPRHQTVLRSSLDLGPNWSWHADVRRVGKLRTPAVPAYTAFDTRIAWAWRPGSELVLGVQNLFDPRHAEWGPSGNRVEFERAVFLRLRVTN
jgi:iron complex outermembrane receptor protein